jgi:hypothetical protein
LEGLNPRSQDLSFGLGMFRDYDFVVSLTRMPAVLIDASLRLVERLVAAEPAARTAPNHVVRLRVLPSLSFHYVNVPFLDRRDPRDSAGDGMTSRSIPLRNLRQERPTPHPCYRTCIYLSPAVLMMHPLVEDVDRWWAHVQTERIADKYGVRVSPPEQ